MPKYTNPTDIELRSEEVQEILGRPPRWLIRYGIMLIFLVVTGLFIGSYFFKYPDILQATITVTTENLPAGVTAKTSGRIDTVFVSEKQEVAAGELLAYIENAANFRDVIVLKEKLWLFSIDSLNRSEEVKGKKGRKDESEGTLSPLHFSSLYPSPLHPSLGELHPAYLSFVKAAEDYRYFLEADYHHKKIAVIEKQIATAKSMLQKGYRQLSLNSKQLESAHRLFSIDSNLYEKKVMSQAEYETSRTAYLQNLQAYEQAQLGIDNQKMSILQSEQTVFDLQQQRTEQENALRLALTTAHDQLQAQIKAWEQNYLLIAPCAGVVTFTKYWQQNQNVNAGEVVVTVVPKAQTKIIGKILLPPQGAGKVKTGQTVNVKFDSYPYMEYGMVKVLIQNISLVPIDIQGGEAVQKACVLEVVFPEKLITNYGKELPFSQEMTGTAEIITEDLRLLDKFINPIKSVLKR